MSIAMIKWVSISYQNSNVNNNLPLSLTFCGLVELSWFLCAGSRVVGVSTAAGAGVIWRFSWAGCPWWLSHSHVSVLLHVASLPLRATWISTWELGLRKAEDWHSSQCLGLELEKRHYPLLWDGRRAPHWVGGLVWIQRKGRNSLQLLL